MTPRELIFAVLVHRLPDRIPRFEIWIDALQLELGCSDPAGIYAHLGQDCVMMPSHQPQNSSAWNTGIDEFGRQWQNGTYSGGVVDSRISLRKYTPSLSQVEHSFTSDNIEYVKRQYPDKCLIWGSHIGPFTAAYMAMGFERFFMTLTDNPNLAHQVLETRTDWCIAMYKKAQEVGAEVLVLGDDAGTSEGPMISPKMWREFVFPYHKRIVDALSVPVIWHSDGDITSLLSMAVEAGFAGYHGVDAIAGLSLRKVKEEFGEELVLIGNVDIRVLFADDLDAVRCEVNRCITEGAPGGRYMFASCNSICSGMNPAAVKEMYMHIAAAGMY